MSRGWFAVLAELLLTADEAAAILSDADTKQPPTNTATAPATAEARAGEKGAAALTAMEEESRRETEALAVLLSNPVSDGGGGSGVPGGAAAQSALTRLAARYLVRETVRGKIPDPVGNFHVRE